MSNRPHPTRRVRWTAPRRLVALLRGDRGTTTVEFALCVVTCAALAATLYSLVTSDTVRAALLSLLERGLQSGAT